jgi:uncharacterized protein (DUF433 family)
MDIRGRIVLDPKIRFGKPTIRGTRITVGDVLSYMAGGMSEDEILADFSELTREDIRACLAFAADRENGSSDIPGMTGEYLEERARRGEREKLERVLGKIPDRGLDVEEER